MQNVFFCTGHYLSAVGKNNSNTNLTASTDNIIKTCFKNIANSTVELF